MAFGLFGAWSPPSMSSSKLTSREGGRVGRWLVCLPKGVAVPPCRRARCSALPPPAGRGPHRNTSGLACGSGVGGSRGEGGRGRPIPSAQVALPHVEVEASKLTFATQSKCKHGEVEGPHNGASVGVRSGAWSGGVHARAHHKHDDPENSSRRGTLGSHGCRRTPLGTPAPR